MADTKYLKRRGESWNFQRTVPRLLRTRWPGPSPIIRPLGTRDLVEAQELRWKVNAEVQEQFDALSGKEKKPVAMTPGEIEAFALKEFHKTLADLDEYGVSGTGLDDFAASVQRKLDLGDPLKVHPQLGPGHPGRIVDRDFAKFRAQLAAVEARRKALNNVVPEVPLSFGRGSVNPVTLLPVAPRRGARGGPRFAEVAARFVAEKQRDPASKLTEQTRGQYEAAFRLLDSWAGQPTLGEVSRARASEFLDEVAKLDPMWGRSPATKKRTFKEIVAQFGNHPRGLSNKTINRVAMALGMVWSFAEDRDGYRGENPWKRQGRPVAKKRGTPGTGKREFTAKEIAKSILSVKPTVAPNKHTPESALPWVNLIAAYSGMRLNEICSLDVEDVKKDGDVWYFDVTGSKTEAGIRCVPIHSAILTGGILEYRKRVKKGPLFPGLKPGGPDKKHGWYLSKRFTDFRREQGLVDIDPVSGRDRLDFHSLRRSVVTILKRARIPEHEVAEVVGHEHSQLTFRVYPGRHKLAELRTIVETIRYDAKQ